MESNTNTIAKRRRAEPCTQVHVTMKKLFWSRMRSTSARLSDIISLSYILRLRLERITSRNDNAAPKFYWFEVAVKSKILTRIMKVSKKMEIK